MEASHQNQEVTKLFDNQKMLLNYAELSKATSLSPRLLQSMVYRNEIPFEKFGKSVRFIPSKIEKWLLERKKGD
jgi:excisionase family DNA binding protein